MTLRAISTTQITNTPAERVLADADARQEIYFRGDAVEADGTPKALEVSARGGAPSLILKTFSLSAITCGSTMTRWRSSS